MGAIERRVRPMPDVDGPPVGEPRVRRILALCAGADAERHGGGRDRCRPAIVVAKRGLQHVATLRESVIVRAIRERTWLAPERLEDHGAVPRVAGGQQVGGRAGDSGPRTNPVNVWVSAVRNRRPVAPTERPPEPIFDQAEMDDWDGIRASIPQRENGVDRLAFNELGSVPEI